MELIWALEAYIFQQLFLIGRFLWPRSYRHPCPLFWQLLSNFSLPFPLPSEWLKKKKNAQNL